MRLGLDIDDCLYDWTGTAKFLLNSHFGYSLGQSTHRNYIRDNVEKKHWNWLWEDGLKKYGLFLHGNTHPGAFDTLTWLNEQGHDLVLITSRPKKAAQDTFSWIAYHQIPTCEVHILGPYNGGKSKVPCDLYLDDAVDNVRELKAAGKMALLFDRPENRNAEDVCRVESWEAFRRFVEQMDQEKGA